MPKLEIDPSGDVALHLEAAEYTALKTLFDAIEDETSTDASFAALYSVRAWIAIMDAQAVKANWVVNGFRDNTAEVLLDD